MAASLRLVLGFSNGAFCLQGWVGGAKRLGMQRTGWGWGIGTSAVTCGARCVLMGLRM